MPNYVYYCVDCEVEFTYFHSMFTDPITVCEECGGKLEKVIKFSGSFDLKGDGWYESDYKDKI